jgi:hypothetical protein
MLKILFSLVEEQTIHRNTKGIKAKLLASINDTSENALTEALNT